MKHQRKFGPLSNGKEAENLGLMLCHSFNFTGWELFRDRIGIKNYRAIWQDNQIIGGLGLYPMAQWWGGNPVTMAGIAAGDCSRTSRDWVADELLDIPSKIFIIITFRCQFSIQRRRFFIEK